ncbi:MAG: ABC transporter ATP-binding protein [Alphaproteobacteria bacterium]
MTALRLSNLCKSYGTVEILHDVNLAIDEGEFVVFVGPSGCGKSTLLRIIAGLETITKGTLEIDAEVMNDAPPSKRGISMVFQSYALYPHMSVYENMAFGLKLAQKGKQAIHNAILEAARMLQLEPYLERLPKALSGGQRQRVAIGRAIVRNPRIFLFDEPLSNLDAALRVATRIEISQLKESLPKTTMIYVTHDQVEAMTLADRIVVLNGGRIEQVGSPMELYHRPNNIFVAQFIGSPAMNMLAGVIEAIGDDGVIALSNQQKIQCSIQAGAVGDAVQIGIRPEDCLECDAGDQNCFLSSTISLEERLGEVTLFHFRDYAPCPSFIAKLVGDASHLRHDTIALKIDSDKLHVFNADGNRIPTA